MPAAAIIVAAVVSSAATAYAANKASRSTSDASNAAITEQDKVLAQQAALSKPYRDLGTGNIDAYQNLLTGGGKGAAGIQSTLESLPGYQFTRDQGIEAAKRASGAGGLNLTGNQVGAVETFGAGLADQTYSERLAQLLQPIQLGQAAAAGQAANVGNAGTNISNILTNQGNTNAAIGANEVAGITKGLSGATNQYLTYQTLQGLNNPSQPTVQPSYGGMTYGAMDPGVNAPVNSVIST